ncbi:MAG: hypothetical protein IGS03_16395 [Candidatus Sericytochromatia bacterium]|nr:hypothetical protein [Candidatus Sericytochromatia bacterium]
MIPALKITGNHPAALWLAHCLHQRGWKIDCEPEKLPEGLLPGAYHHGLAGHFGHNSLSFPPEWCFSRLAGILPEQDTGSEVFAWPVSLLDLAAIWQDLQATAPRSAVNGARFNLQLRFTACADCIPSFSETTEPRVPSGFLIQQNGSWSVRLNAGQQLTVQPPASQAQTAEAVCKYLPALQQSDEQSLIWSCPLPSLRPESMLAQSMYWLVIQEVLAGLSTGSMRPQALYRQWQACWQKVHQGLIAMAKRQKFLPIPR